MTCGAVNAVLRGSTQAAADSRNERRVSPNPGLHQPQAAFPVNFTIFAPPPRGHRQRPLSILIPRAVFSLRAHSYLQANHKRHIDFHFLRGFDHTVGDTFTTNNSAKDVDEDVFDVRVPTESETGRDGILSGAPPTSRKFAGSPPASLITSDIVAMANPAPFTIQPMLPSSFT